MRKSILIFLFALLGVLSAQAYDFEVDGIYYAYREEWNTDEDELEIIDGEVEVTYMNYYYYNSYSGSVVIPSTVTYGGTTYTVTSIGSSAFSGSGLRSVTIPESVTSIGSSAFRDCSGLTSVTIPENVDIIGSSAFYGCRGLRSVTIPESVTSIGDEAFEGCSAIRSPLYNSRVFAYMPRDYSGDYTIPSGIQTIAGGAFSWCSGLTSVTIPENVDIIGSSAFYGCRGLRSVTIPQSVTSIERYAFDGCRGLISVTSLAKLPPYCEEENVFDSASSEYYQTLYVPRGCKSAYESAREWHKFSKIKEIETTTYTVTVNVNDISMGAVVGGGNYGLGEQVMLAAIPNSGYHFVKWDDENTSNPRLLTVTEDVELTAIFAKDGSAPDNPDTPTANENAETDNFRVYAQDRTIYLSENVGTVQVYNVAGQCIYNGQATSIPVRHSGVYIVKVGARSYKVAVR